MKKFLSLVLALVMTFSLVTISAGATEYKDLTDKSTITYSEAVAVLNKLGVITGYEDGSFNPTGSLTRGAAAKIIVSMMIGADAASALTAAAAPYKDVPASNTFAAYISYCKTAGYISGYSDGTFRPADTLTGYAFAKMLLG
ncbi:MAG: S-layer homology domain-containing protein, partial [Oscillibacter sp.]|nr:S-layer homology domain-containing protein [Oscillibacter sp.]